jgi:hypothetical protein
LCISGTGSVSKYQASFWVVDVAVKAGGNVDPRVSVLAAGFQQKHSIFRIGAEPVGQHTTG